MEPMDKLINFGWTKSNQRDWEKLNLPDLQPARVIADFGTSLKVAMPRIIAAELSGKLAHYTDRELTPKVGDWVAVHVLDSGPATIESTILRNNEIARKVAGKKTVKQIIAANVDIAFVLLALDNDFSVERLKRFLYQLSINAIEPVIVLNKADKTDDIQSYTAQLQTLKLPIIISTAIEGLGVDEIISRIKPGRTAILLGSSGVGKSTLTNKLLGRQAQHTKEVRVSDSTGKHTTVHRELFVLPNGGLLIDTPGIRELQLWGTEEELNEDYSDIAELASQCKYASCQHGSEAGCAVKHALQTGTLDKSHYASYVKMKSELVNLAKKSAVQAQHANKRSLGKPGRKKSTKNYDSSEDIY
jgi:ribosome biogenesis GTPase